MTKKKLKLKKKFKRRLIILLFIIIISIVGIKSYKTYKYHQTYEYKLLEKNYTKEETDLLLEKLDKTRIEKLLTTEKNEKLINILNEKYFLIKNLDKYIAYSDKNPEISLTEVIALVNVHRDQDYYENMEVADTSKGNTMLVNKYNALSKDYEVEDLKTISKTYSYGDNKKLNKEAYDAFISLADDAKKEGYTILIVSSYRTYQDQEDNEINIHLTNNETFTNYSKSFEIKKPEIKQSFLEPVLLNKNCFGNEIINENADNENIQKHNTIKREIIIDSKEIYGIPVKTINQTTIWKILKAICEKQDAEGTQVANQLFIKY